MPGLLHLSCSSPTKVRFPLLLTDLSPPNPLPRRPLIPAPLLRLLSKPSALRGFLSLSSFSLLASTKSPGRGSIRSAGPLLPPNVAFSSGGNADQDREILVQHLLVSHDDIKLLLELQRRHAEGEDLGDLAVEFSRCPSKENGGMLGWVRRGQMVPEFEEAAFGAPLNKVVRCKTKFGWHLLEVLSEREEYVLRDIGPEEFHSKMQDSTFLEAAQLIDVREPDEVEQASLPSFKVLPLRQFATWGPNITNKFDPQKDTYVLCHHGVRSLQVSKWLQSQGFRRVFNIAGGIHAYAQVDSSVPTY